MRRANGQYGVVHGMSGRPIYAIYRTMMARCYKSWSHKFKTYGARGIVVCERWHDFANFYADMGDRPSGKSLERINNAGPYSPENCRWATQKEQQQNRRDNRYLEFHGQKKTMAQWARELGICHSSLQDRLKKWPLEKALSLPNVKPFYGRKRENLRSL